MFSFDSEAQIALKEYDIKPNIYCSKALCIGVVAIWLTGILNFLGLYHVSTVSMIISLLITTLLFVVAWVVIKCQSLQANKYTKYVLVGCIIVFTAINTTLLCNFALALVFVPMFIATQYHSRRITAASVAASLSISVLAPPVSCLLGFWQTDYYNFLMDCTKMTTFQVIDIGVPMDISVTVVKIIFYVSIPLFAIVALLSLILWDITKTSTQSIEQRISILIREKTDHLTGLYNQNSFKLLLDQEMPDCKVGVMFFDVDDLKKANDTNGHEYGDLLLKRCSDSLKQILKGNDRAYRIGGDEFLLIVEGATESVMKDYLKRWKHAMEVINIDNQTEHGGLRCHMSVGFACGNAQELPTIIRQADGKMYVEKQDYKRNGGFII